MNSTSRLLALYYALQYDSQVVRIFKPGERIAINQVRGASLHAKSYRKTPIPELSDSIEGRIRMVEELRQRGRWKPLNEHEPF